MDKFYIPQIAKAVDSTERIEFKEFIDGLETLTPVEGVLQVRHQGSFLEVKAKAATIVTLTCDRTLVKFNHRLSIDTSESIWLAEPTPVAKSLKEIEVGFDQLVETLSPKGHFDPAAWLYEQLCLALPHRKIAPDAPELSEVLGIEQAESQPDTRWAALKNLLVIPDPYE